MRKACLDTIYELAQKDKRVFFIGSDLGAGTLNEFKKNIPERFLMEGISEANIIGMAAGLAMEGKIPYVNTIATFLTRRCFEQVVLDLCLHNLNVRLVANGGGLVYAPLGPTHQAIEDLAIFRAVPNMTIVAPCDAEEMKRTVRESLHYQGPMYIRFAKGFDPIVSRDDVPFKIGKAMIMREGADATLLTTGITLGLALEAAKELDAQGIDAAIVHVPTIKPFDSETILQQIGQTPIVVTVEEHTIIGGLGGAVAELIAEADFDRPRRFRRIGIPDVFAENYGSQKQLMDHFGISAKNIINTVAQLKQQSLETV